jgi:DNA alkylation repair enzyme
MDRWAETFDSWEICDQCCQNLFAHTASAPAKTVEWTQRPEEFVKRAGFVLVAVRAVHDKRTDDRAFVDLLPTSWRQQMTSGSMSERAPAGRCDRSAKEATSCERTCLTPSPRASTATAAAVGCANSILPSDSACLHGKPQVARSQDWVASIGARAEVRCGDQSVPPPSSAQSERGGCLLTTSLNERASTRVYRTIVASVDHGSGHGNRRGRGHTCFKLSELARPPPRLVLDPCDRYRSLTFL